MTLIASPWKSASSNCPWPARPTLAIIRTNPGAAERSMDLAGARRHMRLKLSWRCPSRRTTSGCLFEEAVSGDSAGQQTLAPTSPHFPSMMLMTTAMRRSSPGSLIAHEVAHYYWSGNRGWVDEGVADFMASASENARNGGPIEVTNNPCAYARTIAELENSRRHKRG